MKRIILTIAIAMQAGATDCGNVLRDPGYDLWCGDQLCAWKLERGAIMRVPTWNEGDPGVELVGPDVAIEQLTPVDSHDGTCIEFDLIANVDPDAQVELNVDVLGDGTVEHTEHLPSSNWKPLTYQIAIAAPYAGVRFEITKKGAGRARIANVGARIVDQGCSGIDFIVATNRPLGTPCDNGGECASGLCGDGLVDPPFGLGGLFANNSVCIACDGNHGCTAGNVCGISAPVSPVRAAPTECVPAASKLLGEQCGTAAECATGTCAMHVCSTCVGTTCAGGEQCAATLGGAYVCSPDAHARQHGEPCVTDDDCASSSCAGAANSECPDGRACVTAAECPFGIGDNVSPLQNGPCTPVGYLGGTCQ